MAKRIGKRLKLKVKRRDLSKGAKRMGHLSPRWLRSHFEAAIQAGINAAHPLVGVASGMSAATWNPFAEAVGMDLPLAGSGRVNEPYEHLDGSKYSARTHAMGLGFGKSAYVYSTKYLNFRAEYTPATTHYEILERQWRTLPAFYGAATTALYDTIFAMSASKSKKLTSRQNLALQIFHEFLTQSGGFA